MWKKNEILWLSLQFELSFQSQEFLSNDFASQTGRSSAVIQLRETFVWTFFAGIWYWNLNSGIKKQKLNSNVGTVLLMVSSHYASYSQPFLCVDTHFVNKKLATLLDHQNNFKNATYSRFYENFENNLFWSKWVLKFR